MTKSLCAVLALSLSLTACASTPHPDGKPLPAMTFSNLRPIQVEVQKIAVVPQKDRAIGNFVMSPERAAQNYLDARFAAHGYRDGLRLVIDEASVTQQEKPADTAIPRFLGVAGHDIYQVKIRIKLQHVTDTGQVLYSRSLTANRTMNISEHASVAEREQHQFDGMENLFIQLDAAIANIVLHEMKIGTPS